ncbi:MAG TPA: tail fiber protein [Dokdonella sp.]|uniref:phage tail protein n=1 Tax=Dokdonella sp. TaxID=2291710 RepID=UPI002CC4F293|nr:tail fiber protein [Dokdonella sp.]HUD40844.1 tail fiber protein [Dokdonella sp.]
MTEPFIGEIQLFGFNFPPRGWSYCNGATLAIQQNTALFSLIGTYYGGNGLSTFQLPNLMARATCSQGQGPGLATRSIGEAFGNAQVTLTQQQMPAHVHGMVAYSQPDLSKRTNIPSANAALGLPGSATARAYNGPPANASFAPTMLQPAGGGQPHEERQPYLAVNFAIALQGVFPPFD